jgi:signal transduction histidine kinase
MNPVGVGQVAGAPVLFSARITRAAIVFLLWSVPGVISASQVAFLWKPPISIETALIWQLPPWWFWALATPLVLRLGQRFRLEDGGWKRALPIHLMVNTVIAFLHVTVTILVARAVDSANYPGEFSTVLFKVLMKSVHTELILYWGVLAAGWAIEYHGRFRERALAATRLESQLVQAQLDALKAQLHPHFLFNTLHAIGVLVRKQDAHGSIKMLSGLAELLRLALDNVGRQVVPLEQELGFADRYLDIEAIRFQDRLRITRDIDAGVLDAEIPNLVLQPLLENAIRHGIGARSGPGAIAIRAYREGDRLVVSVRDDGVGIGADWHEGVGLSNVRARLTQLYGDAGKVRLEPVPSGGGTLATIEVPFRR